MAKNWLRRGKIKPQIWQDQNQRWAAGHHYTCTYMAMFPPALPHYFIRRFTEVGDTVLDPFSGRGTTAVEAMAQNRIGIGNDWNDLAYVLTKGKIANPKLEDALARLSELEENYDRKDWLRCKGIPNKIKMLYHPEVQKHLMYLKQELDWQNNDVDAFLTMILMGAMHGSSSGFLSVEMPNTFSMSWDYVKKYIKEKKLKRPKRDAFKVIEKRVKRCLKKGILPGQGRALFGDVRNIATHHGIEEDSVKLLFTSPPYLEVIKYGLYNWIRLWWLIGDYKHVDEKLDDTHKLEPYLEFMKEILETTLPLLDRTSGMACWVIGDVKDLNLAKTVWDEVGSNIEVELGDGTKLRYRLLDIVADEIPPEEKVSRLWDSEELEEDKSGKATDIDRILMICPEESNPEALIYNRHIIWNRFEDALS